MKIKNTINGAVGFEIECIVSNENYIKVKELCEEYHWARESDGSINPSRACPNTCEIKFYYPISELNENLVKIENLFKLIKVNRSCGGHIHISFLNTGDYFKLCNFDFVNHFQEKYKSYAKTTIEKNRVNSRWCRNYDNKLHFKTTVDNQLRTNGKIDRYFMVNFNSFNIHNTVEFRVFAATNKINKLVKNVNFIFDTINSFNYKSIEIAIEKTLPTKKGKIVINKQLGFSEKLAPVQRITPWLGDIDDDIEMEDEDD